MIARAGRKLAVAIALLGPSALHAQDVNAIDPREAGATEHQIFDLRAVEAAGNLAAAGQEVVSEGSPTDRASAGFTKPTLQFKSEEGETGVSFAFSLDIDGYDPVETGPDSNEYRVSRTQLSLVASTPIEEEEVVSRLFAGDSLVSGSKIKLSLSRLSARLGNARGGAALVRDAYLACIPANSAMWLEANGGTASAAAHGMALRRAVEKEAGGTSNFEAVLTEQRDDKKNPAAAAVHTACVPVSDGSSALLNEGELVSRYTDKGKQFRDSFYDERSLLTFFGLDASAGRDDHEYLDRTAFQLATVVRTSWEVGAYAGLINSSLTFSARARAVYGTSYEAAEEAEVCRTFADTLEESCLTGPDGLPVGKEQGLISVETRHLFALDADNRIAFAPQLTYRFENDSLGVEVPIYLAPDADGKLTGGIKLAYNSREEDEFGIGVFVGIPFSMHFD
ncbi:MAG TPA: hypothetical protein VI168_05480 [Croceibacterium sp.]